MNNSFTKVRATKDWSQIVLVVVGIILLAMNIFLIVQNRQLKSSLENSRQVVTEQGYRFSELDVRDLDGNQEKIDLADGQSKTLLLVFNSSCQYCKQQYPHWNEAIKSLDPSWRILAISSEDDSEKLKTHIEEQKIENIRVGTIAAVEMRRARMLFTPMTVAIDAKGEVVKVWAGLWTRGFNLQ